MSREVVTLPDGRRAQIVKSEGPNGGKGIDIIPLTKKLV